MPAEVSGVIAALFKQHMLREEQGRHVGLSKCDGNLEAVITSHLRNTLVVLQHSSFTQSLDPLLESSEPNHHAGWENAPLEDKTNCYFKLLF